MDKDNKQLLEEIEKLHIENKELRAQLVAANGKINAIKAGNIDALVVTHKKNLKIYTEKKADKIYQVLIEKMHEGAVTLNEEGTILFCNSYFGKLVGLPLHEVIGTHFKRFIEGASKKIFVVLLKKGWEGYSQGEVCLHTTTGDTIPVLLSVNTLSLENKLVLSIILTDLTLQGKNRTESKSLLIEKITNVIIEMNLYSEDMAETNYSDYISRKLNHSYTYLANIFSKVKGLTIQQFIMIHKMEKVKELLLYGELNLTQIAYKLHYSSVGHLSSQFKKITGLTPSSYKKMKAKK